MATQEERLTNLEQDVATNIRELDENITIMLGVMKHQGRDIKRTFERLETIDTRLNAMDTHLESMDTRLNTMDTRLDRVENILTQILARLPEKP